MNFLFFIKIYISVFFHPGPGRQIPAQLPEHFTGQGFSSYERESQKTSFPSVRTGSSHAQWSAGTSGSRKIKRINPNIGKNTIQIAPLNPETPDANQPEAVAAPTFCRFCGKQFANLAKYKAHEIYHTKPPRFPCKFCGKPSHSKANMLRHERTHTGEKPFKCRFCKKSFPFKETLTGHERLHTGEKPYKCRTCGKRFTHGATCRRHEAANTCFEEAE